MANTLRQRLLQDILELQTSPYPNIDLHFKDGDMSNACLILTVDRYGPMHLTVELPHDYPLSPPRIRMNSEVYHPNIFNDYICASILNTTEGYTPAYTLKGIAIQLLSFFASDSIEQDYGNRSIKLDQYKDTQSYMYGVSHKCSTCGFGTEAIPPIGSRTSHERGTRNHNVTPPPISGENMDIEWPALPQHSALGLGSPRKRSRGSFSNQTIIPDEGRQQAQGQQVETLPAASNTFKRLEDIPNEVLVMICNRIETEDLWRFAEAWSRIGKVMTEFDVIRTRELQCFCLKKDYMEVDLGVGVSVAQRGKTGTFESEFDLLSTEGFETHYIRRSVQGIPFEYWLPLPISHGHWRKVKGDVPVRLAALASAAGLLEGTSPVQVLYNFMNDVVVKLNQQASEGETKSGYPPRYGADRGGKSTLTHASEKAIESYFHLFHLLLCLATEYPSVVANADSLLRNFVKGETSKDACPNLGHLLVASLISTVDMTEPILKAIIKETITRNVVWTLDKRGADMPELSYREPSAVSHYRLQKTFDASKTSYRLLMFLNLFRRVAVGKPRKPLHQLRDEAFARHGAPPVSYIDGHPKSSAKELADSIKRIHRIASFPEFLREMNIGKVSAEWFTNFLRECVESSRTKGYHRMPISMSQALYLRKEKEPGVQVQEGLYPEPVLFIDRENMSFFPGRGHRGENRWGRGGRGGAGGRGGRGNSRGRWGY